jgi:hypothetical protein
MNPDFLQQAWQTQSSQTHLTFDTDLLLKEVQSKARCFNSAIFWRDVREVGTALLIASVWLYLGIKHSSPWTWYLAVPGLLWVAGFMLSDRMRHKRQPPEPGEPLRAWVEIALSHVEHQIWLLRNVLWWYLLPLGLPPLAFFGQSAWAGRSGGWWTALAAALVAILLVVVLSSVYWINQVAAGSTLEPRRRELEALLASLKDEPPDEIKLEL